MSASVSIPVPTLTLTDQDFRALGMIVAQWAIAEAAMTGVLLLMFDHSGVSEMVGPSGPNPSFQKLLGCWKQIVPAVCARHAEYLEIGMSLAEKGRALKKVRDAACHWPAARIRADEAQQVLFRKVPFAPNAAKELSFTSNELEVIAGKIGRWGMMVSVYGVLLNFDLLDVSAAYKPNGARPDFMLDTLRAYHRSQ